MKELFKELPVIKGEKVIIKPITQDDHDGLKELVTSDEVYKLEPTFLFERKYKDVHKVIDRLYDEAVEEGSLILGVFLDGEFCGLAEMYGYKKELHKISIGGRFLKKYWGMGLGSDVAKSLVEFLRNETDIEIIAASSLPANKGSAAVMRKAGFELVVHNSLEDWGFDKPLPTDKWII